MLGVDVYFLFLDICGVMGDEILMVTTHILLNFLFKLHLPS